MKDRVESVVLYNLIKNEPYTRKVLPFIEPEYFSENVEKILFSSIRDYISQYNSLPTREALLINVNKDTKLKDTDYKELCDYITDNLVTDTESAPSEKWLLDATEDWCKDKAIYNAILNSIKILDGKDAKNEKGALPKLLSDALAVGFNTDVGHDYINDTGKRFDFYHTTEKKYEFDLQMFNKITGGGIKKKSLFVCVAGTGVGKSLLLCHMASSFLNSGRNVLYITLEMAEERIAERIDSNLLNVPILDLNKIPKEDYDRRVDKMKHKATGRLMIKEYPTASAHVGHFRHLLQELNLKKNFVPDIVIIDYLNIVSSSRIKPGQNANTYVYIKSIAEELRGLAMEFDVPVITATQTNRGGQNNTDVDFSDVSESHGLSATADYMLGMITTEELDKMSQVMFKQIKNRYGDISKFRRFIVGVDRNHMRLYDVEQSAQENIADSGQKEPDVSAFDKTKFGSSMKKRHDFSKIKVEDDVSVELPVSKIKSPLEDDDMF